MRFWVRGHEVPSATVVVAVFRQAGANAVDVAQSVRDLLPLISAEMPGSVRLMPIYDRSQTIVNSVRDVQETLLHRVRAGGAGDFPVPRPRYRHAHSRRGPAAFPAADVRRHADARATAWTTSRSWP